MQFNKPIKNITKNQFIEMFGNDIAKYNASDTNWEQYYKYLMNYLLKARRGEITYYDVKDPVVQLMLENQSPRMWFQKHNLNEDLAGAKYALINERYDILNYLTDREEKIYPFILDDESAIYESIKNGSTHIYEYLFNDDDENIQNLRTSKIYSFIVFGLICNNLTFWNIVNQF